MPEKSSSAQTNRTPGANEGPKPVRYIEHYLDDAYHRGFETGPEDASKEGEPDAKAAPQALTEPSEERGPDPHDAGRVGGAGAPAGDRRPPQQSGEEGRGAAQ